MSKFQISETVFTDEDHLVGALKDMGYDALVYRENEPPEHLYGYMGDKRPEIANIIVRRKHISRSSNDIGFVKREGVYHAIISQFDQRRHNPAWLGKLAQHYTERRQMAVAQKRGYRFLNREEVNGKVRLQFSVR